MTSPDETRRAVNDAKRNMEPMADGLVLQASLLRTAFDALVAQGFSEDQALQIVKARGANLV